MSCLLFGMRAVENLAQRYVASVESAAIHYVSLADAPCAVLWLEPDYEQEPGFGQPNSPLRVRYLVRSSSFPFLIRRGTRVPPEDSLFWRCSEEEPSAEGEIEGRLLGLNPKVRLYVDCLPQGHAGALLALVSPAEMPRGSPVYEEWPWEEVG